MPRGARHGPREARLEQRKHAVANVRSSEIERADVVWRIEHLVPVFETSQDASPLRDARLRPAHSNGVRQRLGPKGCILEQVKRPVAQRNLAGITADVGGQAGRELLVTARARMLAVHEQGCIMVDNTKPVHHRNGCQALSGRPEQAVDARSRKVTRRRRDLIVPSGCEEAYGHIAEPPCKLSHTRMCILLDSRGGKALPSIVETQLHDDTSDIPHLIPGQR